MLKQQGRFRGKVMRYDVTKSFGFVSIEEHKGDLEQHFTRESQEVKTRQGGDAFIYFSDIEPDRDDFKKLIQDQVVEFDLYRGKRGWVAKELKIVGDYYDSYGQIAFFEEEEGFNR